MKKYFEAFKGHCCYYCLLILGFVFSIVGLCNGNVIVSLIGIIVNMIIMVVDKYHSDIINGGEY